jgi:hypothetical protein
MIRSDVKGCMVEGVLANRFNHIFAKQETFNKDIANEIKRVMFDLQLSNYAVHRLSKKLYGEKRAIPKSSIQDFLTCKSGTSAYNLFRILQVLFHYEAGTIKFEEK